jgi:hypothetical protein
MVVALRLSHADIGAASHSAAQRLQAVRRGQAPFAAACSWRDMSSVSTCHSRRCLDAGGLVHRWPVVHRTGGGPHLLVGPTVGPPMRLLMV